MTINVAINGYGRIGRNIMRAHYESNKKHDVRIVAVNDLGSPETNAHLTRYDTAHGRFPGKVSVDGDSMVVNGDRIRVLEQDRALRLQAQAARLARQQPHADLALQRGDLVGHRRLGERQRARGARERALVGDGAEGQQAARVHSRRL